MPSSPIIFAALGVLGVVPCCYSGPINSPPTQPEIIVPSSISRGQPSTFSANASDPDNDRLSLQWSSGPGPCDPANPPAGNTADAASYMITLVTDSAGAACVCVVARDPYNATASYCRTVMVINHAPIAQITVQQPAAEVTGDYPLYSTFRLSGAASSDPDGDPLTYTWTLPDMPSNYMGNKLTDCLPATSPAHLVECLGPTNEPGNYKVDLVVNDGTQDSQAYEVTLIVDPDQPPCITQTSPADPSAPLVWDPTLPKTFEVDNVTDDGSPYPSADPPNGALTFSWSLRQSGDTAWEPIDGYDMLASVTIPGGRFEIGETVEVRVEVNDGTQQAATNLMNCGDTDICPPVCSQRVTWTVDYQ